MEPETLIDLIEGTEISMTDMIIMTGTTGTDIIIGLTSQDTQRRTTMTTKAGVEM